MGVFNITGPDGKKYRVKGDNAEGALVALKKMISQQGANADRDAMRARAEAAKAGTLQASPESLAGADAMNQKFYQDARDRAGVGYKIADNVMGYNDGVMSPGEKLGTAANMAGESMTLGIVGDEAAAAADAAIGRGTYDERLNKYRGDERQFRKENPVAAFGADVAPALLPGLGAAGVAAKLSTKVGKTAAGALMGAGAGATYGFMEGEGGAQNRAENAVASGALGGLFGAAAPKVMDAIGKLPAAVARPFKRSQERPTIGNLKAAKNAAYKLVDESGEAFSGDDMTGLYNTVKQAFDDGHYVAETDNASRAVLSILGRRQGQNTTLSQLDNIRQNLWKRYAAAKDQPVILDAIKAIDDVIESKAGASELMGAARAANSRYAKSQLLDDAFRKAQDQTAATGSGGNILNKYRQAVTNIINNEKKAKFFSQEELDLMRAFVRGTPTENLKRLVGKMSPNGNGLMMTLHVVGGMASGGTTLPLMAAGAASKASADKGAMKGAEVIKDVLSGYGGIPARPQLSAPQSALITGSAPAIGNALAAFRP